MTKWCKEETDPASSQASGGMGESSSSTYQTDTEGVGRSRGYRWHKSESLREDVDLQVRRNEMKSSEREGSVEVSTDLT